MSGNNNHRSIRSLTERLQPWAKYRGRGKVIQVEDMPANPQVIVGQDPDGIHGPAGGIVVFVQTSALQEIRLKWQGREIDTIPSDDEVAAWLIWIVLDNGGDGERIQES